MAAFKILIPYNFTAYEEKALNFVIGTYAHREDVQVTVFHAYTPLPEIDMSASPEMKKVRQGMAYLSEERRQKEKGLIQVQRFLLGNGFKRDSVDYIFRERRKPIAEEIKDVVAKGHYRVLVLSRQPGKVTRFFARSVHTRILATMKDVVLCIPT